MKLTQAHAFPKPQNDQLNFLQSPYVASPGFACPTPDFPLSHSPATPPPPFKFFRGGQFIFGGGRAPPGGCYVKVPSPSSSVQPKFYKGGQFIPGGGHAPAGGICM